MELFREELLRKWTVIKIQHNFQKESELKVIWAESNLKLSRTLNKLQIVSQIEENCVFDEEKRKIIDPAYLMISIGVKLVKFCYGLSKMYVKWRM